LVKALAGPLLWSGAAACALSPLVLDLPPSPSPFPPPQPPTPTLPNPQATGHAVVKDLRAPAAELQLERVRRLQEDGRWAGAFELRKRKDHFIFTVESTGALPPDALVRQALAILTDKAERLEARL
jgi:hypothetical protein